MLNYKIKNKIHCFNFMIIFVLCVVFTSCKTSKIMISTGNVEFVQTNVKQISMAAVEGIPILAWGGVTIQTKERYLELKECGFNINFIGCRANIEEVAKGLDAAYEAGVGMMIHCHELDYDPEKVVHRFKDHPALLGYFLQDEPIRSDFSRLNEWIQRIKAIDNKHFYYVDLFPNPYLQYLETTTYREYIQLFIKEVPVQFLSFWNYPITANSSGERSLDNGWYENLEIISDEARKAGLSFWTVSLTTAHSIFPIPTLADLRLQTYSNLAYGAQGIQYFTYGTPSPIYPEGYHDGPIDYASQQKTATWYTVQQMNKEIKALSNVFLGAQVIKVEHIVTNALGENVDIPAGTTRFDFTNRPAEASIIKKFIIPNNANAVVSFLKNGKRFYMVVINRNLSGGANVTFTVKGGSGLQLIKKDGTAVLAVLKSSKQTITPGDVLIYGWDIK